MSKREIKFRAWDSDNKQMKSVREILLDDNHGGQEVRCSCESVWLVNYELMQFTGLQDKNGKDIYEGDIARIPNHNRPAIISYHTTGWKEFRVIGAFVYAIHATSYDSDGVDTELILTESKHGHNADCEIIGNIHANPKLLSI